MSGTGAADFVKNIAVSASGTVKLLTSSGSENSGKIATGNKVAVYDASGNLKKTYDIVIYGDINGDGAVNALDMIKLNETYFRKGNNSQVLIWRQLMLTERVMVEMPLI